MKKLSGKHIYNYIRLQRDKYFDEARKHPNTSDAYKENIHYAYALAVLLVDIDNMEND